MFLLKKAFFSYILYKYICVYIYIVFYFLYVDAGEKEDCQWFLLVRSRTKAKNAKKKKRQEKLFQKAENKKSASC